MAKLLSKLKVAKGVAQLPTAKARPGAWKKTLKPHKEADKIHKNTLLAPVLEDKMIMDVVNGISPAAIEKKYSTSLGYIRSLMLRKFGSKENLKTALTHICYENAMAFMGYAATKIDDMSPRDAVLAGKLSIDAGLALEKADTGQPEEIDFGALLALGGSIDRIEKQVSGTDRTLPE